MKRRCAYLLVLACLSIALTTSAAAEKFNLLLTTKTGNRNNAGTDDPVFFALYYEGRVLAPTRSARRKGQTIPKQMRIERTLDNEGDDRKVGAVETYKLEFDCPIEKINAIEIGIKSGDDAWYLDGLQYVIKTGGKTSRPTEIRFKGLWVSGAANETVDSKQYYWFKVKPPVFPVKRALR